MLALPLNGRSYIDLLGLQAGVAPASSGTISQDRPVSGGLNAGNISVNGGREASNAFLVNGGDVSEGRNMGTAIIPNIESVAEFRLLTHSFDAEYGRLCFPRRCNSRKSVRANHQSAAEICPASEYWSQHSDIGWAEPD